MKHTLFFLVSLVLLYSARGQQFQLKNYGIEDGLPHSNVYRILQDKRGFLWFCTDYGLATYNGQTFSAPYYDKEEQLYYSILSMYEDNDGRKFIVTHRNGIYVLTDSSLEKYPIKGGDLPTKMLFAVSRGNVLWLTGNGLYKVQHDTIRRVKTSPREKVIFNKLAEIDGTPYALTTEGIYQIANGNPEKFLPDLIRDTVVDIAKSPAGSYWIGCKKRVVEIRDGKVMHEYHLPGVSIVKEILADRKGRVFVALDGEGMLLIEHNSMRDITGLLAFHKTIVNDMLEDTEGNIWIATYGAGVYKLSTLDILEYSFNDENTGTFCKSIDVCGNKLLTGTIGRVYNIENGNVSPLPLKMLNRDQFVYFVKCIRNAVYVGTSAGLIMTDQAPHYRERKAKSNLPYGAISIYADADGQIWVGDYDRILRLQGDSIVTDSARSHPYWRRSNVLMTDKSGAMWNGTDSGVIVFRQGQKPQRLLKNYYINDIAEDNKHRIWLASSTGLICIDKGRWSVYKKEHGLMNTNCNKVLADYNNRLWVGTLSGLNYVDLVTINIHNYTPALYTDEILTLCMSGSTLYLGTINKLIAVNTYETTEKNSALPVYITSVKTSKGRVNMPQTIDLPYNETKLAIAFIGLCYSDPRAVEYRYKIKGLNDNWYMTSNTSIELPALPSGNYALVVNARRKGGAWSNDATLKINVSTPYWKTWWFAIACVIAFVAIGFFIIRRIITVREAKRRARLVLQNRIIYLRQQALSALINPHFIFNCMNSIQYFLDTHENDKANDYLADFAHLIRMTMEDAQKTLISLEAEITRIKLYLSLEQLRFGDNLRYTVEVEETVDTSKVMIPNMILQPYVENAIWHGIVARKGSGNLSILFSRYNDREIKVTIEDDGIGIVKGLESSKNNKGHYGMKITAQRLYLLGQLSRQHYSVTVKDKSETDPNATGTIVQISLPANPKSISTEADEA